MATTVIGDLLVKLRGDTTHFEKQMAKADKRLKGMGKKMRDAGRSITMGLSLPLAGVGIAAVKMSSDLDMTMSRIVGLVGESREDVAAWREELLQLGPTVGKSANELAEALFFVTSAGIKGKDAMDAVKFAAMGASAGLGDTATVADAATSAMNAYASSGLNAEQATAMLVATVREGKAEAGSLAPVLGSVLPIASQLSVSFDQVGAAMAAMTRLGLNASEASTALRSTLSQLSKVTPQQEKAAAALGLSFSEIRKVIREDGLITGLTMLKERVGDSETAMTKLFPNVKAVTGVLSMVGENAAETEAIFKRMAATTGEDLASAFAAAEEQAGFKFKQALVSLQNVMIRIGDDILPVIVPQVELLAERLQSLAEWWKALDEPTKTWALRIAGLLVVLGPVLSGIGLMASGIGALVSGIGSIAGVFSSISAAATAVGSLTAGVGAATAASAGLVAGLAALALGIGALVGTGINYLLQKFTALNHVLDMYASKQTDMTKGLAGSRDAFEAQYDAFVKMRKQLGLSGPEWAVQAEHTKENAKRLGELTEKAIVLARKKSTLNATIREGIEAWDAEEAAATKTMEAEVKGLHEATAAEASYLEELKKKYEVLSKDDIKDQMEDIAKEFHALKGTIDETQLAENFNEPMLKLAKLAKENAVAIPKPFADAAAHMGTKVIPGLNEIIATTTQVGGNFKTQGKVIEGIMWSTGESTKAALSGGFKDGVTEGIKSGDVEMTRWVQRIENEVIYIPVQPNFDAWNKAVEDHMNGSVPDTGG